MLQVELNSRFRLETVNHIGQNGFSRTYRFRILDTVNFGKIIIERIVLIDPNYLHFLTPEFPAVSEQVVNRIRDTIHFLLNDFFPLANEIIVQETNINSCLTEDALIRNGGDHANQ